MLKATPMCFIYTCQIFIHVKLVHSRIPKSFHITLSTRRLRLREVTQLTPSLEFASVT